MLILQVDLTQLSDRELDALDTQGQIPLSDLSDEELDALEVKLTQAPPPAPLTAESMQKQFESYVPKDRSNQPGLIERMDASVEGMLDKIHPYKSGDKITDLASLADISGRAIQHGVIMGIPKAIAGIPDMAKSVLWDPYVNLNQALLGQPTDKTPMELVSNIAPLVLGKMYGLPGFIGGAKGGQLAQTGEVGTLPENLEAGTEMVVGGKATLAANKALGDPISRFNAKVEAAKGLLYPERIKQAFRAEGTNPKELAYSKDTPAPQSAEEAVTTLKGGESPMRTLLNAPKSTAIAPSGDPYASMEFLRGRGEFDNVPSERAASLKAKERVGGRTEVDDEGGYTRPAGQLGKELEDYAWEATGKQLAEAKSGKGEDTRISAKQLLSDISDGIRARTRETNPAPGTEIAKEGTAMHPEAEAAANASMENAEMALRDSVSSGVKERVAKCEKKASEPLTDEQAAAPTLYTSPTEKVSLSKSKTKSWEWRGPEDDPYIINWDEVLAEQPLTVHNLYRYRINLGERLKNFKGITGPVMKETAVFDKVAYDAIGKAESRGFEVDPALKAKYEDAKIKFSHYKNIQRWLDEAAGAEKKAVEGGQGSRLGRIFSAANPRTALGRLFTSLTGTEPVSSRENWRRSFAGDALMTGENRLSGGSDPLSMRDLAHVSVPERLGMMADSVTGNPAVQGTMMGGAGMSGLSSLRTPAPELPPLPSDYDKMINLMNGKPELRAQYDALVLSKDPAAKAQMRTFITELLQEDSKTKVLGAARGGFSPVEAYKASIEAFKSSFRGVMGNP